MLAMSASSANTDGAVDGKKKTKEPTYYRFTQQELPASRPVLTPTNVIAIFVSIAAVFIPVGIVWVIASAKVRSKASANDVAASRSFSEQLPRAHRHICTAMDLVV